MSNTNASNDCKSSYPYHLQQQLNQSFIRRNNSNNSDAEDKITAFRLNHSRMTDTRTTPTTASAAAITAITTVVNHHNHHHPNDEGDNYDGHHHHQQHLCHTAVKSTFSSQQQQQLDQDDDLAEDDKNNRHRKDFPYKLHCMLEEVEKYNDQHIVSWQPDGKSFRVYRPDDFVNKIMPQYFHQTQYRSFQRMLNLYEFTKVVVGPTRGSYSHPKFIRSDRSLCLQMRIRKRTKKSSPFVVPTSRQSAESVAMVDSALLKARRTTSNTSVATTTPTTRSRSGSVSIVSRTHLHQPELQQRLMAQSGLTPSRNAQFIPHNNDSQQLEQQLPIQQQQLLQQQQQKEQQQHFAQKNHDQSLNSVYRMVTASMVTASNFLGGSHGSVTTSISADRASLHHHTKLQAKIQESDPDYASQKIQVQRRLSDNSSSLNFMPAPWDTPIVPRDVNPHDTYSSSIYPLLSGGSSPSSNGDNDDGFASKLKSIEDPLFASSSTGSFRQNQNFGVSNFSFPPQSSSDAVIGGQAMHMGPGLQDQQQDDPHQQLLRNYQQQQELYQQQLKVKEDAKILIEEQRQQQNDTTSSANQLFHLPLSSDLEPTPFPD